MMIGSERESNEATRGEDKERVREREREKRRRRRNNKRAWRDTKREK